MKKAVKLSGKKYMLEPTKRLKGLTFLDFFLDVCLLTPNLALY